MANLEIERANLESLESYELNIFKIFIYKSNAIFITKTTTLNVCLMRIDIKTQHS